MPVSQAAQPPLLPPRTRPILAALWLSLGLHGALIALVQVAPPASSTAPLVIEARLENREPTAVSVPAVTPAVEAEPQEKPVIEPEPVAEPRPERTPEPTPITVEPVESKPKPEFPEVAPALPVTVPTPVASAPDVKPSTVLPEREERRSLVEIPSAVDLSYYSAREVDVLPRALRDIRPDYPAEADRRRLSGSVKLQIKLEADGRVSDIEVMESTPKGMFDESALAAFRQARFSPAQRDGRPVRARILIEVKYDYEGRLR